MVGRCVAVRLVIVLLLIGAAGAAAMSLRIGNNGSSAVRADIDRLLAQPDGKISFGPRMAAVVAHGDAAVPLLAERYARADYLSRTRIVQCLGRIGSSGALDFLDTLLSTLSAETLAVVFNYPKSEEARLFPSLVRLAAAGESIDPSIHTRLRRAILDAPARAEQVVEFLRHCPSRLGTCDGLHQLLCDVAGYGHACGPFPTSAWVRWWERNRGRSQVEWLADAFESPYRYEACRQLMTLDDPRAVPLLVEGLGDDDPRTRYWAAVGLRRWAGIPLDDQDRFDGFLAEEPCVTRELLSWWEAERDRLPERRPAIIDGPSLPGSARRWPRGLRR